MTTSITNISDFVEIKDEEVYTTSRIVAEKFGKRHADVLEAIEATIKDIVASQPIENVRERNFPFSENKAQPIENIRNPKNRVSE